MCNGASASSQHQKQDVETMEKCEQGVDTLAYHLTDAPGRADYDRRVQRTRDAFQGILRKRGDEDDTVHADGGMIPCRAVCDDAEQVLDTTRFDASTRSRHSSENSPPDSQTRGGLGAHLPPESPGEFPAIFLAWFPRHDRRAILPEV